MEAPVQLYWRPGLRSGVVYTIEKLALEYRERRVMPGDVFEKGGAGGAKLTFLQILREEPDLQKLIGEASLPETLDGRRGVLDELRHRVCLFLKVVHQGDFTSVEFLRRLERSESARREQQERAESAEADLKEELRQNGLLQRGLSVACHALRDTVAGLEFSLQASAEDRESLAKALRDTLQKVLVAVGDRNSRLAVTQESVSQLLVIYQAEREAKERAEKSIQRATEASRRLDELFEKRKDGLMRYHESQRRLFNLVRSRALMRLDQARTGCQHVAAATGRLRGQLTRMVRSRITQRWRIWKREGDKDLPAWLLAVVARAYGPNIAYRDVLAVADATVLGSGRYGIVLTHFALYVRDQKRLVCLPWGSDHSINVERSNLFHVTLNVDDHQFAFNMLYSAPFIGFVNELSELLDNVSVPESAQAAVASLRTFEPRPPKEEDFSLTAAEALLASRSKESEVAEGGPEVESLRAQHAALQRRLDESAAECSRLNGERKTLLTQIDGQSSLIAELQSKIAALELAKHGPESKARRSRASSSSHKSSKESSSV